MLLRFGYIMGFQIEEVDLSMMTVMLDIIDNMNKKKVKESGVMFSFQV